MKATQKFCLREKETRERQERERQERDRYWRKSDNRDIRYIYILYKIFMKDKYIYMYMREGRERERDERAPGYFN